MTIMNSNHGENIDIKVLKSLAIIEWDKETVITWARTYTAKYKGLAMTDDNVDEIKEVCADLARKVKRLDEIRLEQGRAFKAPLDRFYTEIKEVQKVMEDVRDPLWDDIAKFEESQRQVRINKAKMEIDYRAVRAGLRAIFAAQLTVQDSWANKGAFTKGDMTKAVKSEIDARIATLMQMQKAKDDASEMKRQRDEMAEMMCKVQSKAAGLAISIKPADIYGLAAIPLAELPTAITNAVTKRKASETAAVEQAEKARLAAETKKAENEAKIKAQQEKAQADAEAARIKQAEIEAAKEAIRRVEAAADIPFEVEPELQYKMILRYFGTKAECEWLKEMLAGNGIDVIVEGMEVVK